MNAAEGLPTPPELSFVGRRDLTTNQRVYSRKARGSGPASMFREARLTHTLAGLWLNFSSVSVIPLYNGEGL